MKSTNSLDAMPISRRSVLAAACAAGFTVLAGCSSSSSDAGSTASASDGSETDENQIGQPTDFELDVETGEFSFTATDENAGYYTARVFKVEDGVETGDQVVASDRINGGTTGTLSGSIDLTSGFTYGDYDVNLVAYPPSGTDYVSADPVTIVIRYGEGGVLEQPELLAMYQGNEVNLIIDWWSLCDYNSLQCMPEVKFTFYSDEALSTVAQEETVDTSELLECLSLTPPGTGYIWGVDASEGVPYYHETTYESVDAWGDPIEGFQFLYDFYTYNPGAGTCYITAQAVSPLDYVEDSQESSAVVVTLTEDEVDPYGTYSESSSDLWEDPENDGTCVYANPSQKTDRIDRPSTQSDIGLSIVE